MWPCAAPGVRASASGRALPLDRDLPDGTHRQHAPAGSRFAREGKTRGTAVSATASCYRHPDLLKRIPLVVVDPLRGSLRRLLAPFIVASPNRQLIGTGT